MSHMHEVKIITEEPTIAVIAEMKLDHDSIQDMVHWVRSHRPECLPEGYDENTTKLFPHNGRDERIDDTLSTHSRQLSDNELLVELAGRTCYHSYGLKAGRNSNREYIAHMQSGDVPHASVLYHAKMSFFIGGISRRVSHELIRNYVGADRDEEGSPSQESTRFTHHYGWFVAPPRILGNERKIEKFRSRMQNNYHSYLEFIQEEVDEYKQDHGGEEPKGMDRKRIYEAASHFLSHSAETSLCWTTNAAALAKLFRERCAPDADAEFKRFASMWKKICLANWPNLFPQPWMNQ